MRFTARRAIAKAVDTNPHPFIFYAYLTILSLKFPEEGNVYPRRMAPREDVYKRQESGDGRLLPELREIQIPGSEGLGDGGTVLEIVHGEGHVAALKFLLKIAQDVSQV